MSRLVKSVIFTAPIKFFVCCKWRCTVYFYINQSHFTYPNEYLNQFQECFQLKIRRRKTSLVYVYKNYCEDTYIDTVKRVIKYSSRIVGLTTNSIKN